MGGDTLWDSFSASQLTFPPEMNPLVLPLQEKNGAVYTKPWVVELILDLAGYTSESNLVERLPIEPAARNGALLPPMALRLTISRQRHNRPTSDMTPPLLGYALDQDSAHSARYA